MSSWHGSLTLSKVHIETSSGNQGYHYEDPKSDSLKDWACLPEEHEFDPIETGSCGASKEVGDQAEQE
eukprot:6224748-Ditylum_brightwellii.AAC.1